MITASASSMDFGRVEISVEQSPRTWTVTNNGDLSTSPLTFSSSNTSDIIATNNCPTTLPGGAQCTITVAVKASIAGPISGNLQLAAAQGGSASLAVTATGSVRLTVTTSGTGTVTSLPAGIACGSTCSALFDSGATVTLQARTANGSGFFFSTWSGGGCAGPSRDCQIGIPATSVTTQATFAPMSSNLIFVSSGTYPPNRGSAAAYASDSTDAATAAGINDANGGAFTAVTSDAASTVVTRLGTASGWVRMDGRPFADTLDGLFQRNQVFNSIRYNERGEAVGTSTIVMTGTTPAGSATTNCSNWTTAAAGAVFLVGNPDGGPARWTDLGTANRPGCDQGPFRIICMGHSKTAPVAPARASGRLIWLSAALYYNGNPTVTVATPPDQVCQSEKPAGVTTAAALLAYSTRGPSAVLSATTNYVRADGVLVGTGDQLSTAGTLESGIWQGADGTYRIGGGPAGTAMTGGPGGPASNTCTDWTSVNGTAVVGDYDVVTAGNWWNMPTLGSCQSPPKYIYCVQTAP
jgi:hypothetical protein